MSRFPVANHCSALTLLLCFVAASLDAQDERVRVKPLPTVIDFKAELQRIAPTEPADTIDTFQVKSGFKIQLVASEPLIRDPVSIDFDENGRMFAVEFPEYNQKHVRKQIADRGRVRLLEDTDGDGVFDRSEIYVDDLSYPTSVACYGGGVFVATAPDILFCRDSDGDDHADIREVVYTGFGQEFQRAGQAQLNSFRWGLDNRFHVCTNFSGGAVLRPDDPESKPVTVRNRGFLFDPRTRGYEAASGGGQHGLAIDDWGREFRCRNSDPFKLLIFDERYLSRNPYLKAPSPSVNILETGKHTELFRISRDEPWRVLRTRMRTEGSFAGSNEGGRPFGFFTSATGITVYRGDTWPAEYRGTGFVGEVANNLIFRAEFEQAGVGLVARRADAEAEFVASTDNWFRPVQFANGPDGALYVVDMYRELIEGAAFLPPEVVQHINVTGGVNRGRIYRIVPDDFSQRPAPQLGSATTAELVSLLEHRNGWHRDTASRLLFTRQDSAAEEPLRRLVGESGLPEGRVHALYALDGLDAIDEQILVRALDDAHPRVREHAIRLAERRAAQWPAVWRGMLNGAHDRDTLVRFQTAFSLGARAGDGQKRALLHLLRQDGADPWFRLAVLSSTGAHHGEMFTASLADAEIRQSDHGQQLLNELASQIGTAGKTSDVRLLAEAIETLPSSEDGLARSLARRSAVSADSPSVADALLASGGKAAEIMKGLLSAARRHSLDVKLRDAVRVSAIRSLGLLEFAEIRTIAPQLLEVRQPKAVQEACIRLLGRSRSSEVASILLQQWAAFSPDLRAEVIETLASREPWLAALLDAVQGQTIQRGEMDPARIQILTSHPNRSIAERAKQLFAQGSSPSSRQDVVAAYQAALRLEGDPGRGKESFRRVCSACHVLERVGTAVGADLKAIRNRGMPAILLNVLDPNREVKPQYLTYLVLTADGRAHTGMIQSESANSITLRRPDNTSLTILRIDIEAIRNTGLSFMPEGLEKQLGQQSMADLLAYLDSIE